MKLDVSLEKTSSMVATRGLGDGEFISLSDGFLDLPAECFFSISSDGGQPQIHPYSPPIAPRIAVNAFAWRTAERTYLFDCGSQTTQGPTCGRFMDSLAAARISPNEVDGIFLTHMHPDHSNGLTDLLTGEAIFPNAHVFLHRLEFEHWFDDDLMARADDAARTRHFKANRFQLAPYVERGGVFQLEDGQTVDGIRVLLSAGHTPGHTAYILGSDSEQILVLGDVIQVAELQIGQPAIATRYDKDPFEAHITRKRVLELIAQGQLTVAGSHFAFPGLATLTHD